MDIFTIFPSWVLPTALLLFFPFIFMYAIRRKSSALKLPPGPRRLPFIGNLHQTGGDAMLETLWNLSLKYGPSMLLHFGAHPWLIISSAETAGELLKTHDQKTCTRPQTEAARRLTYNYMDVAFAPYGDHWRDMRKVVVTDFLGTKRTKVSKSVMATEIEGLVRSLLMHSLGTTVNLEEMLFNLVDDVVCKVTLGKTYRGKTFNGKTMTELLHNTLVMSSGSLGDTFTFGWIVDGLTGWDRKLQKCFSDLDEFLQMVIDEHLHERETINSKQENDFLDDCLSRLTIDETKAVVSDVLQGAIETTALSMVWAMSAIVKHPRVMQKLQNEIQSCVGDKSSVHDTDITKMQYLKMVVKEALRLHPPAGFLMTRECLSHCQIGGYDVLPGTKVMVNVWGIGRDPKVWKESPTEFLPERFEKMQVEYVGTQFQMVPFGGGRRACPGYNFANSTSEFIIANLLHSFDWEAPNGVKNEDLDMTENGFSFIHRKTPLCLVPKKHK